MNTRMSEAKEDILQSEVLWVELALDVSDIERNERSFGSHGVGEVVTELETLGDLEGCR